MCIYTHACEEWHVYIYISINGVEAYDIYHLDTFTFSISRENKCIYIYSRYKYV